MHCVLSKLAVQFPSQPACNRRKNFLPDGSIWVFPFSIVHKCLILGQASAVPSPKLPHRGEATPLRAGTGCALAASADRVWAGELRTGADVWLRPPIQTVPVSNSVTASRHGP